MIDNANYFFKNGSSSFLSSDWRSAEDLLAQEKYQNLIDKSHVSSSAAKFLARQRQINSVLSKPSTTNGYLAEASSSEENKSLQKKVKAMAAVQIIQQFYDMYISPVGSDITYRLGDVTGEFPAGEVEEDVTDSDGRISTRSNFNINLCGKIAIGHQVKNDKITYANLYFPPYTNEVTKTIVNPNSQYTVWIGDEGTTQAISLSDWLKNRENLDNSAGKATKGFYNKKTGQLWPTFDLVAMKSARQGFTYRSTSFKSINDNIQFIQFLFEGISGITSTYLTEWDLSLYIQEGLVSDSYGLMPEYISLVHRLTEDNPMGYTDAKANSFGILNCSVSKIFKSNEEVWYPNTYPLAHYWTAYPDWKKYAKLSNSIFTSSSDADTSVYTRIKRSDAAIKQLKQELGDAYTSADDYEEGYDVYFPSYYNYANWSSNNNSTIFGVDGTLRNRITRDDMEGAALSGYTNMYFEKAYKALYTSEDDGLSDVDQELIGLEAGLYKKLDIINNIMNVIYGVSYANAEEVECVDGNIRICADDIDTSTFSSSGLNYGSSSYDYASDGISSSRSKYVPSSVMKGALTFLSLFKKKKSSKAKTLSQVDEAKSLNNKTTTYSDGSTDESGNSTDTIVTSSTAVDDMLGLSEDCIDNAKATGIPQYNPTLYGGPHGYYYSPKSVNAYYEENNCFWRNNARLPIVDLKNTNIKENKSYLEKWSYSENLNSASPNFGDSSFTKSLSYLTDGIYSYIYEKVVEMDRYDVWISQNTLYINYKNLKTSKYKVNGHRVYWLGDTRWVKSYQFISANKNFWSWSYSWYNNAKNISSSLYKTVTCEWINGPKGLGWYFIINEKQQHGYYLADTIKYKKKPIVHSMIQDSTKTYKDTAWEICKIRKTNWYTEPIGSPSWRNGIQHDTGFIAYVKNTFKKIISNSWNYILYNKVGSGDIVKIAKSYEKDVYQLKFPWSERISDKWNSGVNFGITKAEQEFMDNMISPYCLDNECNKILFLQGYNIQSRPQSIFRAQCKISTQQIYYYYYKKHNKRCRKHYYTKEYTTDEIKYIEVDVNNADFFFDNMYDNFSKLNNTNRNLIKLNQPTDLKDVRHPVELFTKNYAGWYYNNDATEDNKTYPTYTRMDGNGCLCSIQAFYPENIKNKFSIVKYTEADKKKPLYTGQGDDLQMSFFVKKEPPCIQLNFSNINNIFTVSADNVPAGSALTLVFSAEGYATNGKLTVKDLKFNNIVFYNVNSTPQRLDLRKLYKFKIPTSYESAVTYESVSNTYESFSSTYESYESRSTKATAILPSKCYYTFSLMANGIIFSDLNNDQLADDDTYGIPEISGSEYSDLVIIPNYSSRSVSITMQNLNYQLKVLPKDIRQAFARMYTRCTFYQDWQKTTRNSDNSIVTGNTKKRYYSTLDNAARDLYNSLNKQKDYYQLAKELFCGDKTKGIAPQITPAAIKEYIYGNSQTNGLVSKRTLFLSNPETTTMKDPEGNTDSSGNILTVNKRDYYGYNQWIYEMLKIFEADDTEVLAVLRENFDNIIGTFNTFINRLYNPSKGINYITIPAEQYSFNDILELLKINKECKDTLFEYTDSKGNSEFIQKYIYAYLNVLYEARKYFINKRCNKQDGTLWCCRQLESAIPLAIGEYVDSTNNINLDKFGDSFTPYTVDFYNIQYTNSQKAEAIKNNQTLDYDRIKTIYIKVLWTTEEKYKEDLAAYNAGTITERNVVKVPVWEWERKNGTVTGKKIYTGVYKYAIKPKNGDYYLSSDEYTANEEVVKYNNSNYILQHYSEKYKDKGYELKEVNSNIDYAAWYITWGLPVANNKSEIGKTDIIFDVDKSLDPEKIFDLLNSGISDTNAILCGGFNRNAYWVINIESALPKAVGYKTNVKIKPITATFESEDTEETNTGSIGIFAYNLYPIIADQTNAYPNMSDMALAYQNYINKK